MIFVKIREFFLIFILTCLVGCIIFHLEYNISPKMIGFLLLI